MRLVAGHFPLCLTDVLGVPFHVFTVLRDPVERTLSLLRRTKESVATPDTTLEEFYADPTRFEGRIKNHMVKMLSVTIEEIPWGTMT